MMMVVMMVMVVVVVMMVIVMDMVVMMMNVMVMVNVLDVLHYCVCMVVVFYVIWYMNDDMFVMWPTDFTKRSACYEHTQRNQLCE